jgi:hypothetical protein
MLRVAHGRRWLVLGAVAAIGCGVAGSRLGETLGTTTEAQMCSYTLCPSGPGQDDTSQIQAAIDAAAAADGGTITFGPGIYNLSVPGGTDGGAPGTDGGVYPNTMLHLHGQNITLLGLAGTPPPAILRVADNVGAYTSMFNNPAGDDVSGLVIENLTFDGNAAGSGNAMRAQDTCDMLLLASGDPTTQCNGVDHYCRWILDLALASKVTILKNVFQNMDDVNVIHVNSPRDSAGTPGITNITIDTNHFNAIGGSDGAFPHDHSTLSILANFMTIQSNTFVGSGPGAETAIETHGGAQSVTGNTVTNYANGFNLSGQAQAGTSNSYAEENALAGVNTGFSLWSFYPGDASPGHFPNANVVANYVSVDPANWYDSCDAGNWVSGSNGVNIVSGTEGNTYAGYQNLTISQNTINYEPSLPADAGLDAATYTRTQTWNHWSYLDRGCVSANCRGQCGQCVKSVCAPQLCAAPAVGQPQWLPRPYDANSAGILDLQAPTSGADPKVVDSYYAINNNIITNPPGTGIWVEHQSSDAGAPLRVLVGLSLKNNVVNDPGWGCPSGSSCPFAVGYIWDGVALGGNLTQADIQSNSLHENRSPFNEVWAIDGQRVLSRRAGDECNNSANINVPGFHQPSPFAGGLTLCSGSCVDTTSDPNNCGGCGNVCFGGFIAHCVNSMCQF